MIRPVKDNVYGEPLSKETKRTSGLLLTEESAKEVNMATAVAVGPAVNEVKQGEVFIYKPYSATEVTVEDKKYILINEEDILGVRE